ncbi:MAG: HPr family phosphocarrier protein [Chloroflexi bacterium]|nr:HPr family phosphocarrier protein [Chloroflexota bacterium]
MQSTTLFLNNALIEGHHAGNYIDRPRQGGLHARPVALFVQAAQKFNLGRV